MLLAPAPPRAADAAKAPTFTKDVAPIFQDKCEACHRPDSIAPMSLVTYRGGAARGRARSRRASPTRQMPPWHIDKTVGIQEFKNDRSLSDEQIDTIVRWVDAGAPQGDPKDMPPPKTWPDEQGWNFAQLFGQTEPDLIVKSHAVHDAGACAGRVVASRVVDIGHHRAALGARDRDPSEHRQGPQDHASRDRVPAAGRNRSARAESRRRQRQPAAPARSWNGRSASRAR